MKNKNTYAQKTEQIEAAAQTILQKYGIDSPECGFYIGLGWMAIVDAALNQLIIAGWDKDLGQVKQKFCCYDSDTEVLTENGWKYFKDLTYEDNLATLDVNTDHLVYQKPTDIIADQYNGQMYSMEAKGISLLTTPNHRLYVAKGSYYNGKYKPPKKVDYDFEFATPDKYFQKKKRFQKGALWQGNIIEDFILPKLVLPPRPGRDRFGKGNLRYYSFEERKLPIMPLLRFLGWYVAEGDAAVNGQITISYNYTDGGVEREVIKKIINDLGYEPHIQKETINIYNKQLALWLMETCGKYCYNKIAPAFIKKLGASLITEFLYCLFEGDGHKSKTANILTTTSKRLADDVQELLLKAGFVGTCYKTIMRDAEIIAIKSGKSKGKFIRPQRLAYTINWLMKSYYVNYKNIDENWVDYSGQVYCATVPNGILYIRRNGKPVWCGNSLRIYIGQTNDQLQSIIRSAEALAAKACENCGLPHNLKTPRSGIALCKACLNAE